jgi:outer membrane protein TolC
MVVSQSFDFPSAYVHKSKIANLSVSQFDERFRQSKLEILTNTVQVYAELIYTNRKILILENRQQMGVQLQTGIEKRVNTGDANIFEVNRIRSELAKVQSELQLTESRRKSLLLKLSELNGGKPITVSDTIFPLDVDLASSDTSMKAISARSPQIKQWETEVQIAGHNISLQRSLSLPKFEIGYRQDINTGQTFNGFHTGITIPLFENKNTLKSAKLREIYATDAVNAYKLELQSSIMQLITELNAVQQSRTSLIRVFKTLHTYDLLLKAYNAGQINYTEFFTEYENYQQTALYIEELNQKTASLQLQLYVLAGI